MISRTALLGMMVAATMMSSAVAASASPITLTRVEINNNGSGGEGVCWATVSPCVMFGIKSNGTFLNPNDEGINVDLSAQGVYDFQLFLNKGSGREMTSYNLLLQFDGSTAAEFRLTGSGTRDAVGLTPSFSANTYTEGSNIVSLTGLLVSSFGGTDVIGEFAATPDGNVDYIGNFQLTVGPSETATVPEPATFGLVALGLASVGFFARRGGRNRSRS